MNIEKYEYIRLKQREQWQVAMHPDSPLAQKEHITPKDLKDLPLTCRTGKMSAASWQAGSARILKSSRPVHLKPSLQQRDHGPQ